MTERTTVRLPEELLLRAKRKATAEGRTLTSLIEEGLRLVIANRHKRTAPMHNDPPVSEAKGGLLPGVDLTSYSAFEEEEDLAHLAQLQRRK
jgi:hypothetical protein